MTRQEANELPTGVYILDWMAFDGTDDGGQSVASVGVNHHGDSWYAPANWLVVPSYDWHRVKSATLLRPSFPLLRGTDDRDPRRFRAIQKTGQEDRGPGQPGQGSPETGDAPAQEAVRSHDA